MKCDEMKPLDLLAEWESHGAGRWGLGVAIDVAILRRRIEEIEAGLRSAYVELPSGVENFAARFPVKTADRSDEISANAFAAADDMPPIQHPFNVLISLIEKWAADRGILEHSTPQAQLLKTMSELGELSDAVVKDRPFEIVDAIGDVLVTLVIFARMHGMCLTGCLQHAYDQIKDRKGRMVPGGAFVKEGDE